MHCTIIPIKSLKDGKKRLESFLTSQQRKALILTLLKNVLNATAKAQLSNHTLLVTPDSKIIEITKKWNLSNLEYLVEYASNGTNQAVQLAIDWCASKQISSILIIPADIPLVSSDDIDELIKMGKNKFPIVLVPSQRRDGTNAFYLRPPNLVKVWYGPNSFQKNLDTISKQKLPYIILEKPAFALDIDLKEDLEQLYSIKKK